MDTFVSIDAYAAGQGVSTRTVRRWLDAGRISGAVKVSGAWSIPANARPVEPIAGVMDTVKPAAPVHPWAPPRTAAAPVTVASELASIPVMVPVDTAARILGISERAVRRNPEYFHLVRLGGQGGAYVMPKARIRELEG